MESKPIVPSAGLAVLSGSPLGLRIGYWLCIAIAVAVVIRRFLALVYPSHSAPAQLAGLDAVFASHAALTLAHILPALAFVLVTPFVVFRRSSTPGWPDRLIFFLGAIVGITAYAMSYDAVGGWIERSAVLFFNSLFLFSLARAFFFERRGGYAEERRWLLRAIVVLLGIATTRPVMGVFFATASATRLVPSQFFGIAFWIGFSINAIAVELWLHSAARRKHLQAGNSIA
jgi:hypothetical protein